MTYRPQFRPPEFRRKVVSNFYPRADLMRLKFDMFFAEPYNVTLANFVLNYWYVKDLYLYIRAHPEYIVGPELAGDFLSFINAYAHEQFGMQASPPYLSIYVNSMYQSIHSDQRNGTYGYVFSLTDWNSRTFTGGETMLAREGAFEQLEPRDHRGRDTYMEAFPPVFNQLLLFDDRVAHCVNPILGGMDPLQGRVVIHGHIS